ncbi:uncharacterized protein BDW70DRAFT_139984 [Aspergillus foveolatus]|uniref:uncharacterized protein n=1 Tax=Aspergillus foveolatus TaxID=210207 RepID=UPI003CCCA75A
MSSPKGPLKLPVPAKIILEKSSARSIELVPIVRRYLVAFPLAVGLVRGATGWFVASVCSWCPWRLLAANVLMLDFQGITISEKKMM